MTAPRTSRREPNWRLLDIVAFVTGTAVASIHLKDPLLLRGGLSVEGLVIAGLLFLLLALTATGPFIFSIHRFVYRTPGFPTDAEAGWMALGLPWTLSALWRSMFETSGSHTIQLIHDYAIKAAFVLSCLFAIVVVVRRFRRSSPELQAGSTPDPVARSHTDAIGVFLVSAWPLQYLVALMLEDQR